jgi:membrane dipeptidase
VAAQAPCGQRAAPGIVIDLAHASERTFDDVLARGSRAALCVSHAACAALRPSPRNPTDAQLRDLARRDGFLGIMCLPFVVRPDEWTLDRLVDHVDHATAIMGSGQVGLGGDFVRQLGRSGAARLTAKEWAVLPPGAALDDVLDGVDGPEDFGNLVDCLTRRGYGGTRLEDVTHGALLRLLRRALPA